jgi:hypothetical protein
MTCQRLFSLWHDLDCLIFHKEGFVWFIFLLNGILLVRLEVAPLVCHVRSMNKAWSHGFRFLSALLISSQVLVPHIKNEDVLNGLWVLMDLLFHLLYLSSWIRVIGYYDFLFLGWCTSIVIETVLKAIDLLLELEFRETLYSMLWFKRINLANVELLTLLWTLRV